MRFVITPRRRLGIAIPKEQLRHAESFVGDVIISECKSPEFGRSVLSAEIYTSGPGPGLLPPLLDVKIMGMSHGGMSLSGIEKIGDAYYAQSWWCRVE